MTSKNQLPASERRRILAQIHIARKQLNMDEDVYRDKLEELTGKRSAGVLDVQGLKKTLDWFYSVGFRPTGGSLSPVSRQKRCKTRADKLVALWIELHKAGKVRDRSHQALQAFVKRQIGGKLTLMPGADPIKAATPQQLADCIHALEVWLDA
ncbi:DUF1018 domain-containing protein [Synechococcales cyanobacterium C]|uniref:DUF1018 domain-containing protein n=1 Tax=Petrachloros mirabilis ULC683 TaxID=2781853 RepID=A0A8K1ZW37_9CYAN|nr:regulatory protein GemA [Petrachloros mirabilis]NCJ05187.1 DUF1018 domain-containing protein [Petrachloros mirabilis ULC683]